MEESILTVMTTAKLAQRTAFISVCLMINLSAGTTNNVNGLIFNGDNGTVTVPLLTLIILRPSQATPLPVVIFVTIPLLSQSK